MSSSFLRVLDFWTLSKSNLVPRHGIQIPNARHRVSQRIFFFWEVSAGWYVIIMKWSWTCVKGHRETRLNSIYRVHEFKVARISKYLCALFVHQRSGTPFDLHLPVRTAWNLKNCIPLWSFVSSLWNFVILDFRGNRLCMLNEPTSDSGNRVRTLPAEGTHRWD